jgi:hypothetical protein
LRGTRADLDAPLRLCNLHVFNVPVKASEWPCSICSRPGPSGAARAAPRRPAPARAAQLEEREAEAARALLARLAALLTAGGGGGGGGGGAPAGEGAEDERLEGKLALTSQLVHCQEEPALPDGARLIHCLLTGARAGPGARGRLVGRAGEGGRLILCLRPRVRAPARGRLAGGMAGALWATQVETAASSAACSWVRAPARCRIVAHSLALGRPAG